jgi:hypothetical protein
VRGASSHRETAMSARMMTTRSLILDIAFNFTDPEPEVQQSLGLP